ncbi:hypothetical protein JCM13664_15620 [Methylothermus subterraneus]
MGNSKLGFDIRAHWIADEATGEVLVKRVEVKDCVHGVAGPLDDRRVNEW